MRVLISSGKFVQPAAFSASELFVPGLIIGQGNYSTTNHGISIIGANANWAVVQFVRIFKQLARILINIVSNSESSPQQSGKFAESFQQNQLELQIALFSLQTR